MKCFFHKSDFDGKASAAIIYREYPDCQLIGVDYNDLLTQFFDIIRPGETVYVVDFCFEPFIDMITLNNLCNLVWIDHHKTSVEWARDAGFIANAGQVLEIGKGACELTWEYFHKSEMTPYGIKLLSQYDVWNHKNPEVLPFQFGLRQEEKTWPNDHVWGSVIHEPSFVRKMIDIGEIILKYQKTQHMIYAKGMSFEVKFEGYRAIVMNLAYANSKAFDTVYNPEKHDIMIMFGVKPGQYKYTLFCNKPEIDVSKIALKYGGGGHQGAAGFYLDKLLF